MIRTVAVACATTGAGRAGSTGGWLDTAAAATSQSMIHRNAARRKW
jgi:hypothetical protein